MSHTTRCETATTYTCKCPCGGARHGAVLSRGITSTNSSAQDEAFDWANPKRWTRAPAAAKQSTVGDNVVDRQPAMTGVISELTVTILDEIRKNGQVDAIDVLAQGICEKIGDEFESHLAGGGPKPHGNRHLWCVVLATICRLYDQTFEFTTRSVDKLVGEVMNLLREDVSAARGEETRARDIYAYKHLIAASFKLEEYAFLEVLAMRAIGSIVAAMKAIGEETVMKHLRLIGGITCPDPDRHPDVVKYCMWPLLAGPFRELLEERTAVEMRKWLRNAYVSLPRN